jgi:opacity protein-like surface antigen
MKKIALFALLLTIGTVVAHAQESRQDFSISGSGLIEPYVTSTTDVKVSAKRGFGALFSYRFMLTPRGAIEANYQYVQNNIHYVAPSYNYVVNTQLQEGSAAYVYNFTYRRFNPFVEVGGAALIFYNVRNLQTTTLDVKSQTIIALLYGAGLAYELSPSFDIRAEYRAFVSRVPNFGDLALSTNQVYNIYNPTIGIAYHF